MSPPLSRISNSGCFHVSEIPQRVDLLAVLGHQVHYLPVTDNEGVGDQRPVLLVAMLVCAGAIPVRQRG